MKETKYIVQVTYQKIYARLAIVAINNLIQNGGVSPDDIIVPVNRELVKNLNDEIKILYKLINPLNIIILPEQIEKWTNKILVLDFIATKFDSETIFVNYDADLFLQGKHNMREIVKASIKHKTHIACNRWKTNQVDNYILQRAKMAMDERNIIQRLDSIASLAFRKEKKYSELKKTWYNGGFSIYKHPSKIPEFNVIKLLANLFLSDELVLSMVSLFSEARIKNITTISHHLIHQTKTLSEHRNKIGLVHILAPENKQNILKEIDEKIYHISIGNNDAALE